MVSRLISRINLDISNIWSNRESAKLTIYMSNVSTSKIKKKIRRIKGAQMSQTIFIAVMIALGIACLFIKIPIRNKATNPMGEGYYRSPFNQARCHPVPRRRRHLARPQLRLYAGRRGINHPDQLRRQPRRPHIRRRSQDKDAVAGCELVGHP